MKKEKRKKNIVKIAAFAFCLLFALFNFKKFSVLPWENIVSFNRPKSVAVNDEGVISVIDSMSSRVVILTGNHEVSGIITCNGLSAISPEYVVAVAMDNDNLYILDSLNNDDDSSTEGYRVLVYNLNGKYVETLFSCDGESKNGKAYELKDIGCCDGDINVMFCYCDNKTCIYKSDITDGKMKSVEKYDCGGHDIFSVNYNGSDDIVTVLTQDGYVYSWDDNQSIYEEFKDANHDVTCCQTDSEGRLFVIDRNRGCFAVYSESEWSEYEYEYPSVNFTLSDNKVYAANNMDNRITIRDISDGDISYIVDAEVVLTNHLLCWMSWLSAMIVVAFLIAFAIRIIKNLCRLINENKQLNLIKEDDGILTTSGLYGPIFSVVIICIVSAVFVLGMYFYNETMNTRKTDIYNTANTLSQISDVRLGDALSQIENDGDYNSDSYETVIHMTDAVCAIEDENDNDIKYIIYRFIGDNNYVIYDPYGEYRIGTRLLDDSKITDAIAGGIDAARNGIIVRGSTSYNGSANIYGVAAPIYDSNREIVGVIIPIMNTSSVSDKLISEILIKFLELVTFIAGIVMIIAEGKLLKELYLKQKKKHNNNDYSTMIEIDRSLRIFSRIPGSTCALFITILASKILSGSGTEINPVLLALPLTLSSIFFGISNIFGGLVGKHNPKKYIRLGMLIEISAAIVFICAMKANSFILLSIGGGMTGLGSGTSKSAEYAIRMSGKPIDKRYSLMVFCNVETSIAGAIGGSLGSVFLNIFGNNGLFGLIIITGIIAIVISEYFVGSDINVPVNTDIRERRNIEIRKIFGKQIRFLMHPSMLVCIVLVAMPLEVLKLFKSFVMPLLNESFAYPEVYIGIITFVVEMIMLFVVPLVIKEMGKIDDLSWVIVGYGILAVCCAVFGAYGSMITFILVLLFQSIIHPIFSKNVIDEIIKQSKIDGLDANDTFVLRNIACTIGENGGPILLSFMLLSGTRFFGLMWAGILIVFCLLSFTVIIREKHSS